MNVVNLPWEREEYSSVAARIASALAQRIVQGALGPGELLTEVEVAKLEGVSRTPIREAFLQLSAWGLVRLLPKKGALVTTVSPRERRDLLDVRATWEIRAIQTLTVGSEAHSALVEKLKASSRAQSAALAAGDPLQFASLDFAFHLAVIHSAGNEVMTQLTSELGPRLARLMFLVVAERVDAAHIFHDEHDHLIQLIAAGDAAGFSHAIRAHIQSAHFPTGA